MYRVNVLWILLVVVTVFVTSKFQCNAFTAVSSHQRQKDVLIGKTLKTIHTAAFPETRRATALAVFGGGGKNKKNSKKDDDDEPMFTDTGGMTREEMLEYNRQSEKTMNVEFVGMTVFSLVISAPLLYLAWVGLFSETNEISGSF